MTRPYFRDSGLIGRGNVLEKIYSLSCLKVTLVNLMLTEARGHLCGGELDGTKEF